MRDINYYLQRVTDYAAAKGLIKPEDKIWTINIIAAKLQLASFKPTTIKEPLPEYPSQILSAISDYAARKGIIDDLPVRREMFETEICGVLTLRPSDFIREFEETERKCGVKEAVRLMYKKQERADYIKTERIAKNIKWSSNTSYGSLDITINLSKPEKTPEEIAAIKQMGASALKNEAYPKCMLCLENEGYAGRLDYPARQNLRLIPLKLNNEDWFFQYSPYVYYKEHCIVLNRKHTDMLIDEKTFVRFADFLKRFSHYFIGSNADLPIVGGSILNHDHYQGGNYIFPLQRAKVEKVFKLKKYPKLKCQTLKWPLTVIRFTGARKDVLAASRGLLNEWIDYCDETAQIKSHSGKTRHNAITPIARMDGNKLQLDLILRNNRTSAEEPDGIFHSHKKFHHIKRENIGLIEAMGLAVLPGRLKKEFEELGGYLIKRDLESVKNSPSLSKHYDWAKELLAKHKFSHSNYEEILKRETGEIFRQVLECCGVFKRDARGRDALDKFLSRLNDA
jgi:UDPglucose--hexose-1-phosphate uridylyltransferase